MIIKKMKKEKTGKDDYMKPMIIKKVKKEKTGNDDCMKPVRRVRVVYNDPYATDSGKRFTMTTQFMIITMDLRELSVLLWNCSSKVPNGVLYRKFSDRGSC
ncbi:hypothetical protein LOK49_LG14G00227 [Camellia lanceoleosa]|uniref:Uncharacterized protein n=1 Tax=Camellia lanceoleosa TaxID=1840588 RepID=A0ACC0F9W5_9ERIC|nr:hypothetical protein LOK49_LG14G00227 [Camellia lanceoleosa]